MDGEKMLKLTFDEIILWNVEYIRQENDLFQFFCTAPDLTFIFRDLWHIPSLRKGLYTLHYVFICIF